MSQGNLTHTTLNISNETLFPELIALLRSGHTVSLRLKGVSMRPFLEHERDIATLKLAENPQIGEPVLAEISPGKYVLHRLIAVDGDKATLLGDGNLTPEHCRVTDIKAQVVGFYRKGRTQPDLISGRKWRTYSAVWMALRPVRRILLGIHRRLPGTPR